MRTSTSTLLICVLVFAPLAGCGGGGVGLGGPIDIDILFAHPGGLYAGLDGQPVQFDGSGSSDSEGHALTYDWSFGDGSTGTGVMPTHTYATAGTYVVTLQVCDSSKCSFNLNSSTSALISAATGTSITKGIVSGFGSVIVGETHHLVTAGTAITVDDNPGNTESDLELGDYVEIRSTYDFDGTSRTFTADAIEVLESIEGPVDLATSIIEGPDTGNLQVLGQKVRVTPATILDNTEFSIGGLTELFDNDYVEVHGLRRPDGSVDASQVERKLPAVNVIEITGNIDTTDPLGDSFTINGLTVTYTLAGLQNFPGAREPAVNDLVEVKGTPASLTVGPTLAADSVELKTRGLPGEDGDLAEVEGYIEGCPPSSPVCDSFNIGVVSVQLASSVTYEGIWNEDDLGSNIKIEAEGNILGGVLIADKIGFKIDNKARIEGFVESNSGTALVLLRTTFQYDTNTAFEDNSGSPVGDIALVENGHYVVARGDDFIHEIQATDIGRGDPSGDGGMVVRGGVKFIASPPEQQLGVLNLGVELTASTQCRNLDDEPYPGGCTAFYNDVKIGITIVKARGVSYSAGVLTADEIEIEN